MTEQVQLPEGSSDSDIAIVGLAGRFPGARDVAEFWRNLRGGVESGTPLSDDELRAAGVSEEDIADPNYVRTCYPLPEMDRFDAGFFGFAPREAAIMDPQQRHFLEVAWNALEHAGHAPDRFGGSIGVFAGCGASAYLMFNLLSNPDLVDKVGFFLLRHTGNDKDFLATRVSYLMNLRGPSINVQTACSTSLVAIHLAAQSLLNHECDMALAGGTTVKQPHQIGYLYKEGEIMAPDGHCRPFDAKAEGTVFGSGVGVVVLRRLADAIRDGDTIHAVIKGSAINNDGSQKVGFLAPSVDGQAQAIAEALTVADVDPESIQFVECHGTATPVGDPIEIAALTQAFASAGAERSGYCIVSSLKSNVGHLDTAAGVAGVIKTVEALKHREIPPTLHYSAPNPAIDFDSSPFYATAELKPWTTDGGPRRAGVSSLGAGGTNAHVVLEEAPAQEPSGPSRAWQLFVTSAKTPSALGARGAQLAAHLADATDAPADIAFTLAAGRQSLPHRRFAVARDNAEAARIFEAADDKIAPAGQASDKKRAVAFMFAGGGAQYPGMGADLYDAEPVYRAAVDECITLLQPKLDWNLRDLLLAPPGQRDALAPEMERPSRSLPCLFTTQYAMARLCMALGIEPQAMIGHSMGEYTAAHLAGVFSLADGLALVSLRGQLFEKVPPGGMVSVPLSAEDLASRLPPELSIAAVNAPDICVASGPLDALERLERDLAADEIDCRRVRINIAAHSAMLEPILTEFGAFFRGIKLTAPTRPFVSNVTGTWITAEEATSPDYWVRHLRQTVRFADGLGVLLADDSRVLLEVGPGRTLATLASLHSARTADQPTLTSMRHPDEEGSDVARMLTMVGRLWLAGVVIDWSRLWSGERRRRIPLPTYPFEHQPYFIEPGKPAVAAPSLARRADVGQWFHAPSWTRTPLQGAPTAAQAERWLVYHDTSGPGRALAQALASEGTVISVVPGTRFEARSDGSFAIDPTDPAQGAQLIAEVTKAGPFPSRVVHAWTFGPAAGSIAEAEGRAFYSLLGLLQAIGTEGIEDAVRLDVVSAGLHRVGGEAALDPLTALALGPIRVAGKEFPNVRARNIDFGLPDSGVWVEGRAVAQAVAELRADDPAEMVAWRGGDRFVLGFSAMPLPPAPRVDRWIRDGAVCLITGGLGGIGQLVAGELAGTAAVKLALLTRGALPDRSTWPAVVAQGGQAAERIRGVMALEAGGAEVMVVAADVGDREQLGRAAAAVRERFGPITHVIHAAGLVEDALIAMKEPASAARVLQPKVRGTLALADELRSDPVEKMVLFSSRGAVAGVAGQVDYAAASAFLDAFAERLGSVGGIDALSIDWSAWEGLGITASLGGGAEVAGRATSHPFLDQCVHEEPDQIEYRSTLSIDTHWLLDGHRIRGGEALIPGTGWLEIIRAAAEERGRNGPIELRDIYFIAPFAVHGSERRELRVTLEGTGEREVVIEGRPAGTRDEWLEHVRAVTAPAAGTAPAAVDPDAIRSRCTARQVTFTGNEDREHLVLGRRWSNISQLDYGDGEALATLALPEEYRGEVEEYRLHPPLLDVATACAQALIPGFDPKADFYIPVSYGRVRVWDRLPAECFSHIRYQPATEPGQDTALYDVTVFGRDGKVALEINDFTMMRVKNRVSVGHEPAGGKATPLNLQGAMTAAEGLDALRRILSAGLTGTVIVSPQDLGAYLAALTEPAQAAAPEAVAAEAPPPINVGEVEAVLAAHETMHQCVVTAHRERNGSIRITAFVVFAPGEQATVSELRRFLRGKLPDDMIPQHLVELDEMPLQADGQIDRANLPDPFAGADDFIGPRSDMEKTIAGIWKELLGVNRVSVHDNFLDVGGHSLLAMRAVSRIAKQTGVRLNPSVMTLHTLEQIAAECAEKSGGAVGQGAGR